MVDLMDLLRDVLVCSLQVWMLNDFGKNMFPYRVGPLWKRIGVYFAAALCIFIANHMGTTLFNITIIPVSYTIAAIIIFQGSKWKKVIMACCYYMLAIIPEFLFAAITEAYGVTGTANEFQSELEKTLAILLMKTMTFLLVKCINQITRKKNYLTIENKLFTVLLTLPIATIIIFMCIYYSHISFTGVNRIMIPIGAALLLMTNICIFAVFDKLIERSEEVKKMELLYQKSKAENINQKYINKVNEDKRAFLHDVNKFLCITANLIENGKNLELDNMVRHLGIRIQEMKNYSCCADPVLNSILCERKFVAESKGILYKIKLGNNLRTDFIEDLDLISIVGNLLLLERTFASLIDADIKKAGHQVDNDTLQQVIEYLIFNNGGNITVQALCSLTGKFAEVGAEFQRLHSMSATERMNDLYTTIERPNGQLMEHQRKMLNVLFRVFAQNFRCVSSYIPKVYTGKMRVFDCESAIANFFPSLFSEDKKTWEQYAQGEFLFDTMKGDHISCMNSPYIEENVKKILDL